MKSPAKSVSNGQKTVRVIKNAHSVAEQREMGDRWAEHEGPYMTLAETLAHAAEQAEKAPTGQPTNTH